MLEIGRNMGRFGILFACALLMVLLTQVGY